MHFSVSCPGCHTEFPVDSQKVPPGGVHAICSTCERVFLVERPQEASAPAVPPDEEHLAQPVVEGSWEADAAVEDEGEPDEAGSMEEFEQFFEPVLGSGEDDEVGGLVVDEDVEDPNVDPVETGSSEATDVEEAPDEVEDDDWASFGRELTLTEEEGSEEAAAPAVEEEAPEEEPPTEPPRFGQRDPHDKAVRLARVLVQDMIAYNRELYEKALDRGTLEEDFEDEVQKSWEEYVDRIGEELATSTTYFKEALNEILAKGDELFDGPP